ncbi:MAG: hypothetical protein AAB225_27675 [Acidobacteriota bacterium]
MRRTPESYKPIRSRADRCNPQSLGADRGSLGVAHPLAAFRASGYLERVTRERAAKAAGAVSSYA